jgi:hypothetical protein
VGDAGVPFLSTHDREILIWCEKNGFLLVTNNRASMPVHLQAHLEEGHHLPGIFIINPKMNIAETADELALIWGASESEEYYDQLLYLPLSR